jgi:hypothetical protein
MDRDEIVLLLHFTFWHRLCEMLYIYESEGDSAWRSAGGKERPYSGRRVAQFDHGLFGEAAEHGAT